MPTMATMSHMVKHACSPLNMGGHVREELPPAHGGRMYLRVGKQRLRVDPTSSEHELFHKVSARLAWPKQHAYLEWSPGCVTEILNEDELRLACRLMSDFLYSECSHWRREFDGLEAKVQQHMAEPDSDPEDGAMKSDDDMTMDDFYMMGFRHEICN